MLKVGSKFYTFDELSKRLEEFQQLEKVQLWVRDSRTVVAAAKRARRKSLNPALKYAELTYSCVFGGRRPSDQTKTHNQTSAGGCPFKVRLSTSVDGQALVVKEICHDHNHEPGKKLHEEPRRLYKKTPNRTTVRKPVRYIVNKQRVSSSDSKNNKSRLENTESHIQLGQSPFHHLHLHKQQYQQQQQQIKLQLQQHLQQQQLEQQIRQRQAEVIQLDSPDHIDTPDHLSSPDLSTPFDQLGSLNNSVDQYSYLPPSPISPSLSSGCLVDCEEDERLEPILDLEEALEEALGDLDSVGSMEVDANLRLSTLGSSTPTLVSQSEANSTDDHTGPPPAKRQRGRPRKQSFSGTPPKGEKAERDLSEESKEGESSSKEEEFGGSHTMEKNKTESQGISRVDIAQANAMARQLHVYKPGIDFVPGARLEVLDARDNNWYQCKVVEVDWGELDILVHYERWSNRFDEWLKMDSTRIRPLIRSSNRKEKKGGAFRVGDKVSARWPADGKRYQAKIVKALGDDQYEVLFFDGVTKVVRAGGLQKVEPKSPRGSIDSGESCDDPSTSSPRKQGGPDYEDIMLLSPAGTTASSNDSRPSSPEPSPSTSDVTKGEKISAKKSIFDVEIIEQKRKPKRKAAVEELFQSIKKRRKLEQSPPAKPLQSRFGPVKKSRNRRKNRDQAPGDRGPVAGPSSKLGEPLGALESGDRSTCESPMPLPSPGSIIVDLDAGWKKCCVRRTTGSSAGKWDVYYVTPEGRKMRCRTDLARYLEEAGYDLDAENFDFSVRNMRELLEAQKEEKEAQNLDQVDDESKETLKMGKTVIIKEAQTGYFQKKQVPVESKDPQKADIEDFVQKSCSSSEDHKELARAKLAPEESSQATHGSSKDLKLVESKIEEEEEVNVDIIDIKKEKVEPDVVPDAGNGTKQLTVKKLDVKMKIEIPIMPKTEPLGSMSSGLLSPSSRPWSPKSTGPPKSHTLPGDSIAEDEKVKLAAPAVSTLTSAGGPSRQGATPARPKHILKKEPVLAPNEFIVKSQHNEHKCPKSGCLKSFRKESLLQMHIKHYHPDILKKGSNIVPNVADLAYARTVGDHLDINVSPTHPSPPVEKVVKTENTGKKSSRSSLFGSPSEIRGKSLDKKSHGPSGSLSSSAAAKSSKDTKKKELIKIEPGTPASDDEPDIKEEIDDYVNDLEEGDVPVIGFQIEDPDYIPCEGEVPKKRDRRDRKRSRGDPKSKKRKLVPSESMSEDDTQETKAVTKYRYSKRKGQSPSKPNVSSSNVPEPSASEPSTSNTPAKKLQSIEEPLALELEEDTTDTWIEGAENVSVQEAPAEIINCGCGSTEEEGLMLQCDVCLCWQHGACYNIVGEDQVPDKYICSLCDHPRLERSSHKFRHHQDWLKEGRLPRFSFSRTRGDARLESCVRRGHELTANVLQLSQVLHSLRLKLHIAKEGDHPKFVMWHKKWNEKEETDESAIDASTSGNVEAMERMQDLMDIVGDEGSHLPNPSISNSIITDPQLLAAALESVAASAVPPVSQLNMHMDPSGNQLQTNPVNPMIHVPGGSQMAGITGNDSIAKIPDLPIDGKCEIVPKEFGNDTPFPSFVPDTTNEQFRGIGTIKEECIDTALIKTDEPLGLNQADVTEGQRSETNKVEACSDVKTGGNAEEAPSNLVKDESAGNIPVDDGQNVTKQIEGSIKNEPDVEAIEGDEQIQQTDISGLKKEGDFSSTVIKSESYSDGSPSQSAIDTVSEDTKNKMFTSDSKADGSIGTDSTTSQATKCEDSKESSDVSKILDKDEKQTFSQCVDKQEHFDVKPETSQSVTEKDVCSEPVDSTTVEKGSLKESMKLEGDEEKDIKEEIKAGDVDAAADIMDAKSSSEPKESISSSLVKKENNDVYGETESQVLLDGVNLEAKALEESTSGDASKVSLPPLEPASSGTQADVKIEESKTEITGTDDLDELEIPDVDDIELTQPEDMDASDLTHPEDLDGADEAMDDDEANLDDGDDLALDLGGLESSGEGGMPENSDLAALLSSHSELEQLVTQASSALSSHVPVSHPVPAPIIPEAERIEPVNCKLNLLEHVQVVQSNITRRFDQIEKQLEVLEAEMGLSGDIADDDAEEESEERDPATLQARSLIKLILSDINTVKKISDFSG